ncbi:presenilin family intramembrane aspartyl protease [Chloroflexota bacterium]
MVQKRLFGVVEVKLAPLIWSSLILIIAQIIALYTAFREKDFIEANQIAPPQVSLTLPVLYFFGAVLVLGVILFLLPIDKLRMVFKIMFTVLFAWGIFITLGLSLPMLAALLISLAGGLMWYFKPRVWLHNLLMIFALASVGAVFGTLLSPWTTVSFMVVISVYDILAVRFGYMLWMVKKLSEVETLPAFVIPKKISIWNLNLKEAGLKRLLEDKTAEREFSILGGGDIGFPLMLIVSVFFVYGFANSTIVAMFSLFGLISVFIIHLFFLKGKPMPALPPITLMSLIGYLVVYFT